MRWEKRKKEGKTHRPIKKTRRKLSKRVLTYQSWGG